MKKSEIKKILDSKKQLPKLDKKSLDQKNGSEVLRQTSIYEYVKIKKGFQKFLDGLDECKKNDKLFYAIKYIE